MKKVWFYTVTMNDDVAGQEPINIRDTRGPKNIGRTVTEDGYLVGEAVKIRWATTSVEIEGETITSNFFSADPNGQVILFAPYIKKIAEWVVPPDAQPMPD